MRFQSGNSVATQHRGRADSTYNTQREVLCSQHLYTEHNDDAAHELQRIANAVSRTSNECRGNLKDSNNTATTSGHNQFYVACCMLKCIMLAFVQGHSINGGGGSVGGCRAQQPKRESAARTSSRVRPCRFLVAGA